MWSLASPVGLSASHLSRVIGRVAREGKDKTLPTRSRHTPPPVAPRAGPVTPERGSVAPRHTALVRR